MEFLATAIDSAGRRVSFPRSAETEAALAAELRGEGYAPVLIVPAPVAAPAASVPADLPRFHPAWLKRVKSLDVETGLGQLAAMLRSGMTLLEALSVASEQAPSPRASLAWCRVADAVRSGGTLSDAMAAQGKVFGSVAVRLAAVGEKSGELEKTLSRAAEQMEMRRSLRSSVLNALAYPLAAIAMAFGVGAFLVVYAIPKIADFLKTSNTDLPAMTQALVDVSDWTRANGAAILLSLAAFAAAWALVRLSRAGREAEDALLLRIPVTGRILRLSGTALFARAMQIMTESGVTLVEALDGAAALMPNARLSRRAADAGRSVVSGSTLSAALAPAREFMPMMRRMAAVGEATGSLPETFAETARFHETALALAVRRFGMLIEPIMILVAGGIVGFVYVAFFTALFSIAGAA